MPNNRLLTIVNFQNYSTDEEVLLNITRYLERANNFVSKAPSTPATFFIFFALFSATALADEPSNPTQTTLPEPQANAASTLSDVMVAPIGLIEWDMSSLTWGGLFGALGAILENAMAGEQQTQTSRALSQKIESSTDPRRLLAQNLADEFNACGKTATLTRDSFAIDVKPSDWKNSKSPKAQTYLDSLPPNGYYVEAGIQNFWIDKQLFGTYLHGRAQITLFDASGNYLDHFSDYSGLGGRIKLVEDPKSHSDAAIKEIEDAVGAIVGKLSKNLGDKFCKLKR